MKKAVNFLKRIHTGFTLHLLFASEAVIRTRMDSVYWIGGLAYYFKHKWHSHWKLWYIEIVYLLKGIVCINISTGMVGNFYHITFFFQMKWTHLSIPCLTSYGFDFLIATEGFVLCSVNYDFISSGFLHFIANYRFTSTT